MPYKATNKTILRQREDGRWVTHQRQITKDSARYQAEVLNSKEEKPKVESK